MKFNSTINSRPPRLSIYNQYVKHGYITPAHVQERDIMNSFSNNSSTGHPSSPVQRPPFRSNPSAQPTFNPSQQPSNTSTHECARFSYTVPGTSVQMTKTFEFLTEHNSSNVINWIEEFRINQSLCGWDANTALNVLKSVLSKELLKPIATVGNLEDAFTKLLLRFYPTTDCGIYYRQLANIEQDHYLRVKEYYLKIKETVTKLAITNRWSHNKTDEKIEEVFIQGLATTTEVEMTKNGISKMGDIIERIEKIESIILTDMKNITDKKNQRRFEDERRREPSRFSHPRCSICKRSNHKTENCFHQDKNHIRDSRYSHRGSNAYRGNNNNNNYERNSDNRNTFSRDNSYQNKKYNSSNGYNRKENYNTGKFNAIKEPDRKTDGVFLTMMINEKEYKALVDTGANSSFI